MENIELLRSVVSEHPNHYMQMLSKPENDDLREWIVSSTTMMNPKIHNMKTRIYWLLNDMKEFPKCAYCGRVMDDKNVMNVVKGFHNTCSVKCAGNMEGRIEKIKHTCTEKYGVSNYRKTEECAAKSKRTCLEKYGVEYSFQSENNKRKSRETCIRKYGVENPTMCEGVRQKRIRTNIERYGVDNVFKSEDIKRKIRQSLIEKYGVDSPMKIEELKQSVIRKSHVSNLKNSYRNCILGNSYSDPMFSEDYFIQNYTRDHVFKFRCKKCGLVFESTHFGSEHDRCPKCYPKNSSHIEKEVAEFMSSFYHGKMDENTRNLIPPYEIDIYVPERKLAFEFDGLFWHSEQKLKQKHKERYYHLTKTDLCEKTCVQLVHIFEDEWEAKKDIVKSRIRNMLGEYDQTIYARKCTVKQILPSESVAFQDINHLQGGVGASVHLGLFNGDELVSVMTFGKLRRSLGSCRKEGRFELIRFCSRLGFHVIGGAGKLLRYFERNYNPVSIVSYADRRWSNGRLYAAIGFKLDHVSRPNYWYMDKRCNYRMHRFGFRKSVLKDKLEVFDESLSDKENMENNGYRYIYDCGNMVFVKSYDTGKPQP